MNAYIPALDGTGTTMVLSPDSEFFRFFKDAAGDAARRAGAGRRRRNKPAVGDFLAAIGLVLVIEG